MPITKKFIKILIDIFELAEKHIFHVDTINCVMLNICKYDYEYVILKKNNSMKKIQKKAFETED